jgi:hypothetical protein
MSSFIPQEEEHQKRLDEANSFFQSVLSKIDQQLGFDSFQSQVLTYLFDYWSVIRGSTFKFLCKISKTLPNECRVTLYDTFYDNSNRSGRPWQVVHGAMLGLMALVDLLDNQEIESLTARSFQLIGHVSNPIRDTCRDIMVRLCQRSDNKAYYISNLLRQINTLVTSDNVTNNISTAEEDTLKLDGILSALSELIPSLNNDFFFNSDDSLEEPAPFLDTQLSQSFDSDRDKDKTSFSLGKFTYIMSMCMLHDASTVRQKAGSIVTKVFHLFLIEKTKAPLNKPNEAGTDDDYMIEYVDSNPFWFIINELLINLLRIHSLDYWNCHEVCLIICEELIRDFINIYLNLIKVGDEAAIKNHQLPIVEIYELILFLQRELIVLLCHPRFEVRRVILQLIPTAVRGKIVLDGILQNKVKYVHSDIKIDESKLGRRLSFCGDIMHEQTVVSDGRAINDDTSENISARELVDEALTPKDKGPKALDRKITSITNASPVAANTLLSVGASFQPIIEMILISNMIKENRHFQEVINNCNSSADLSSSAQHFNHFSGENWGVEVHGRLLEVELRYEFHSKLDGLAQLRSHSLSYEFLTSCLYYHDDYLLNLLSDHFNKLEKSNRSPTSGSSTTTELWISSDRFISMDFVEFYALTECYLINIKERSYSGMSESFSVTPVSLITKAIILLEKIKSHSFSWLSILSYLQYSSGRAQAAANQLAHHHHTFFSTSTNHPLATEWALHLLEKRDISSLESESYKYNNAFMVLKYWRLGHELSGIKLFPTLTDPATNPIIYAEEELGGGGSYAATGSRGGSFSEAVGDSANDDSLNNSFNAQDSGGNMSAILDTPSGRAMNSNSSAGGIGGVSMKKVPLTSPNKIGVGCNLPVTSNINSFQAMNQWNCEAISPLLLQLSSMAIHSNMESAALLTAVVSEWLLSCFSNPLWLDNRKFAKRVLIECLPILMITIQKQIIFSKSATEYRVLILFTARTILESLVVLSKAKNPIELKLLSSLLKAAILAVGIAADLSPQSLSEVYQKYGEFHSNLSINEVIVDIVELFPGNLDSISQRYHQTSATFTDSKGSGIAMPFPMLPTTCSTKVAIDTSETADESLLEDNQEDEFSDWDEEDEDDSPVSSDQYNANQIILVNSLQADCEYLKKQLDIWRCRLVIAGFAWFSDNSIN